MPFGSTSSSIHELAALRSQLDCRLVAAPRRYSASLDVTCLLPEHGWQQPLHERPFHVELSQAHATARIGLQFHPRAPWSKQALRSYCNLIETHAGKHVRGFERGVGQAVAQAAPHRFAKAWRQAYEHVAPCLAGVVAVEILDPKWSSPTKDRPQNDELAAVVEAALLAELPRWFADHPDVLEALLNSD